MRPSEAREEVRPGQRHYSSIIGAIGQTLGAEWFLNSQRAILKRYGQSFRPASETVAMRILFEAGAQVEKMGPSEMRNWLWLVHCMALLSGTNRDPHSTGGDARFGAVLHRIGFGEQRLSRLLEARGDTFNALFERALRRIARYGDPINWSNIAPLVLAQDPESSWSENARMAICRDYVLAAARSAAENAVELGSEDPQLSIRHRS